MFICRFKSPSNETIRSVKVTINRRNCANLEPLRFRLDNFPVADLKSPRVIYLKGFLFLLLGLIASGLLLSLTRSWSVLLLLLIAIWGFCRFYYFAFYVIEHYVDDGYKYAGLFDFFKRAIGGNSSSTKVSLDDDDQSIDHD